MIEDKAKISTVYITQAPSDNEDTFEPLQEWVNINSIFSRLYGANLMNWYHVGIWTLRDSFETNDVSLATDDVLGSRVGASAEWIKYSGTHLRRLCEKEDPSTAEHTSLASAQFSGKSGLSLQRWEFWKSAFKVVAHGEDRGEELRATAEHAASLM